MPAIDILVIKEGPPERLHAGRHLAGMAGVDAVVLGRGDKERLGVGDPRFQIVVGRDAFQEHRLVGNVGVAVFGDPRGAGEQLVIAQHVEERHLDHDGVEQIRPLRQHDAHQEAAIRTAHDAEPARARDIAADQILGDRDEILEGVAAAGFQRGLVPFRTELAAAADIGDDIDAALFEPEPAGGAEIGRGQRHLKPAIAVEQGRRRAVRAQ